MERVFIYYKIILQSYNQKNVQNGHLFPQLYYLFLILNCEHDSLIVV